MQYTSDQLVAFKKAVAQRRQLLTMIVGGLGIACLLGVLFQEKLALPSRRLVFLWLLATVGGTVLAFAAWRCPGCGKYLGRGRSTFCRRCGIALR